MITARSPVDHRQSRDMRRTILRGHPWVLADALGELPTGALPGTPARLADKRGKPLALGFVDPTSHLALRVCAPASQRVLNPAWAEAQLRRAAALRTSLVRDPDTTAYRLVNGEGDGLPGLVVDRYADVAVIKLDGPGPEGFWDAPAIARWLVEALGLVGVLRRTRGGGDGDGEVLAGEVGDEDVVFIEHGHRFAVDLRRGQKTGFYLDQRDNRARVGLLAPERRVLNVFSYTGGFSIYAGRAGATHVTSVDRASPAVAAASRNWRLNDLDPDRHEAVAADAFDWLDQAARDRRAWDLVIVDPPALAPNKAAAPRAVEAYQRLITSAARVTEPDGVLVAASCTAHIDLPTFMATAEDAIGRARRRATSLGAFGQPLDHPAPLPCPELRYLKCMFMRVA